MARNTNKKILGILAAFVFAILPASAHAFVTTSGLPFTATNMYPGLSVSGSFTIENITGAERVAQIESINGIDPDSLGSQINFLIKENDAVLYSGSLAHFMTTGVKTLSSVANSSSKTYDLSIALKEDAPESYMGTSLSFDFCVGFEGSEFEHCGPGVVGPEEPTNPSGPSTPTSSGGGGGGSGQSSTLIIFDEDSVVNVPVADAATIIWKTNKLATSQVVFGPIAGAPYVLDIDSPPGMGYPMWTEEDSTKKINHSMVITDLAPGTYVYRVVSHASPATVSPEFTFTILAQSGSGAPALVGSAQDNENSSANDLGEAEGAQATSTASGIDPITQAASAVLSGEFPSLICIGVGLLFFLMLLGITILVSKAKKNESISRDAVLLVVLGVILTIVLIFADYTCPVLPFWVIVLAYIVFRFFKEKKKQAR